LRCTSPTGAVFGAIYANVAPAIPAPSWLRGRPPASPSTSATWPAMSLVDRLHPARRKLPDLTLNPRAFAQATWRHLLFGTVLGELERRPQRAGRTRGAVLRARRLDQRPRQPRSVITGQAAEFRHRDRT